MAKDCVIQHNIDDMYVQKKGSMEKRKHVKIDTEEEGEKKSCKWVSSETFGVAERSFYEIENDYVENLQVFD